VGRDGGIGDIAPLDIFFPSAETGFATAWRYTSDGNKAGCVIGTADGGKTWRQLSVATPVDVISFADEKNGFGIGAGFIANRVLHTTDGGLNWGVLPSPETGNNPVGLSFVDRQTGFVLYGYEAITGIDNVLNGVTLYKTTDGGYEWNKIVDIGGSLPEWGAPFYFRMFDTQNGIMAWESERSIWFYETDDGGSAWKQSAQYPLDDVNTVAFSSPDKGLIFLSDGKNLSISVYDNGSVGQPVPLNAPVSDYISWNTAAFSGNPSPVNVNVHLRGLFLSSTSAI